MMNTEYLYEGKNVSEKRLRKDMNDVVNLARVKALVKMVPEDKSVLDLGCGIGVISNLLSKKSESVLGVDLLQGNVDIANKFNGGNNVRFKRDDIGWLIKDSNMKFGVIVITEVIEHVENPFKLLTDCNKLLNEGGYLLISTPNATGKLNVLLNIIKGVSGVENERRGFGTETDHIFCWDVRCLLRLCNLTGFKYVDHTFKGASIILKVVKNGE